MTGRIRGYFGRPEPEPAPAPRTVGRPETVGEPILAGPQDDELGSTSWTSQPRVSADGGTTGPLTVRAASICGRRHARHGTTREDAYAVGRCADGGVVLAVADGVGDAAARYSAVGAQLAVVEACRTVVGCLDRGAPIDVPVLCGLLGAQMVANAGRFVATDFDEQALSTTLTAAWIRPDGTFAGFTIGDGEALVSTGHGGFSPVSEGQGGSFTETGALPRAYTDIDEFGGLLAPGAALLLATDGLAVPLRAPDVAAHLADRWRRPPSVVEFLHDLSFERRGESDDRTGACVWFGPAAPR